MAPPHRGPCGSAALCLAFAWPLVGLCCGFVLLSSAAGHGAAGDGAWPPAGAALLYDWRSGARCSERGAAPRPVGFRVSGEVRVETPWARRGRGISRFQIRSANLHVKSRKAPTPEGFIPHSSKLDEFPNNPFYVVWNGGRIEEILLVRGEPLSLANIKKGLASLFQLQLLDGAYFETDASGKCVATYTTLSPTKVLKSKSKCVSGDLEYRRSVDDILSVEVASSRSVEYEFDPTQSHLTTVISRESHDVFVKAKEDLGNSVGAEQKLTFVGKQNADTVPGDSFEEVIATIAKNEKVVFSRESLLTEKERTVEDARKFTKEVANLRENLLARHLGTLKAAKAFLKLIESARAAQKADIVKVLEYKKNQNILAQLYDVLGHVQTKISHEAVMKTLRFESEEQIDFGERYLWSLSMSSKPNPAIVEDILDRYKNSGSFPEKLKETMILTLATMARKLELLRDSSTVAGLIESTILENLNIEEGDQKYQFFRALKNLQKTTTIPLLLQYIKNGTSKEAVAAWKTLRSFDKDSWTEEVPKIARSTFLQLSRRHDSSSRTIALDVLLDAEPTDATIALALNFLASNDTNYEIKQYTLQRIRMKAEGDPAFAARVRSTVAGDTRLINYSAMAPRGLSTAMRRAFLRGPAANGSLVSVQEVSGGIAKRGLVDVVLERGGVSSEVFSLGIFSGGLGGFISGDGDSEGEGADAPTAGMELTVLGTQIRPFVFFGSNGELMGHVWSGTASERTPAFQATIMLQDHAENLRLGNGYVATVDVKGAVSFDLSGKIEISLWNRNAQGLVEKSAGISVVGRTRIDSELVKTQVEFGASVEPTLSLTFDADFASDVRMCVRLTQPDTLYSHNIFKIERIPGSKHKLRIAKYAKNAVPGKTYSLNRKNDEMCSSIFS